MTLLPITKEYFYKVCGDTSEWKKSSTQLNEVINGFDTRFYGKSTMLYFEIKDVPGAVVAYIVPLRILTIPNRFSDLEIPEDADVDFSDWDYSVIKDKHNPNYTINLYHRTSNNRWDGMNETLLESIKEFPPKSEITLTNTRIGYSKKIEIRLELDSWCNSIFFGYEEKLELPFRREYLKSMDNELFNILLWTRKQQ